LPQDPAPITPICFLTRALTWKLHFLYLRPFLYFRLLQSELSFPPV
jgi:hypothetical protein